MIHAVIIDDEDAGRHELSSLIKEHCPNIKVMGLASNAIDGIRAIRSYEPELVFLDIEMPRENGFDMLEKLGEIDFEVIFTTAYDKYAIRAIKFSALDYLLKPIEAAELKASVAKAEHNIRAGKPDQQQYNTLLSNLNSNSRKPETIALPDSTGFAFVPLDEIVRLESITEKTCFFLVNKSKIFVNKTLKEYEELFGERFFRVHHSHLINLAHARKYIKGDGGEIVMSDGSSVEISRRKKDDFLKQFSPT